MFLPDILKQVAERIRPTSSITGIVDNSNGYYTFTVNKLDTLFKNQTNEHV